MSHLRRDPSTGHLYRNSTSHHLARCSCPCDQFATYTVVVSSVAQCTCGTPVGKNATGHRDINGTYTVSQVTGCTGQGVVWEYTENDATPFGTIYSGVAPVCTNVTQATTGLKVRLSYLGILFGGPAWSLSVSNFTGTHVAFASGVTGFTACDSASFTNTETCAGIGPSHFGGGGTATATGDV